MRMSISTTSGRRRRGLGDGVLAVARLADDGRLRLRLEDLAQPDADERLVVGDQDAGHRIGSSTRTAKPPLGAAAGVEAAAVERDTLAHPDQAVPAARRRPRQLPAPSSTISSSSESGAVADADGGVRLAGVLERVRQRLLHDPVGRQLDPDRKLAALARRRGAPRGGPPRAPAPRASAGRRAPAAARAGRLHRCAASRPGGASRSARRGRSARSSPAPRASSRSSPSSTRRSAPACTTIIETLCAIASCSSRAIRARSSTTASRAARSRSRSASWARRSRSPTTRRTSTITTSVVTPNCSAFDSDTGPAAEAKVASVIAARLQVNRRRSGPDSQPVHAAEPGDAPEDERRRSPHRRDRRRDEPGGEAHARGIETSNGDSRRYGRPEQRPSKALVKRPAAEPGLQL